MPDILNNLFPSIAIDTVAVFDQDYRQVFTDARAIKATVKEEAKVMEHPLESGATTVDHRVLLPIEIQLSLILRPATYRDVYKTIQQFYKNGTLLVVQTRSGTYTNQLIAQMPHDEDVDFFDTITLALSLKQVQFITPQYDVLKPRKPNSQTKKDRGVIQPTKGDSVATNIFDGTRNIARRILRR